MDATSRIANYYKQHGFRAMLRRVGLFVRRSLSFPRMILFYCDLGRMNYTPTTMASSDLQIKRNNSEREMRPEDLERIVEFWDPEITRRNIQARFEKGAALWLALSDGKLAGFGWTVVGCTIEPHYMPVTTTDVHLFDFVVFPEYRGRSINPTLVLHILVEMAAEGRSRAFIEAGGWNRSQLISLSKTPFQYLGAARKLTVFNRPFVQWSSTKPQLEDETLRHT